MSRSNHTEAQMIGALKQLEAGRKAEDVGREMGVSKHTIYAWKAKYGGMDVSEVQEAKQLRDENSRLKKLVVDLSLDKEMLKAVIAKNGWSSFSLFRARQHQAEIGNCVGFKFKRLSILNNGLIVFVRHETRIAFTPVALAE